jgi:hypothetical protein
MFVSSQTVLVSTSNIDRSSKMEMTEEIWKRLTQDLLIEILGKTAYEKHCEVSRSLQKLEGNVSILGIQKVSGHVDGFLYPGISHCSGKETVDLLLIHLSHFTSRTYGSAQKVATNFTVSLWIFFQALLLWWPVARAYFVVGVEKMKFTYAILSPKPGAG